MRFISPNIEIEAWIETLHGFTPFPEHREQCTVDEKSGKAAALVESHLEIEEGKSFRIRFRCIRPQVARPEFDVDVRIDGRRIRPSAWRKHKSEVTADYMYISEGGVTKRADLAFASLPKTDEEASATVQGQAIDRLCKIEVTIRQGKFEPSTSTKPPTPTVANVGVIYEKNKKLGSTIQAANSRPFEPTKKYRFIPDKRDPHVCRFVWKYHTRPQLSLMGIIEDDEPAAPIPAGPSAGMSDLARLAAQLQPPVKRKLEGANQGSVEIVKKVKRERTGTGSENKPIIVAETAPIRTSAAGRVKAELIDLTDD